MTEAGMSHERFCTLCGLTFDEYTELWDASLNMADIIWVSYYRVLRTRDGTIGDIATGLDSEWFLSGVGQDVDQQQRMPPPGYDIRDVLKGRADTCELKMRSLMNEDEKEEWENFEKPYTNRDPGKRAYFVHPRCWDILLQQHALIAPPNKTLDLSDLGRIFGDRFRQYCTTDSTGLERRAYADDRITCADPGIPHSFDELLANPPLEPTANTSPRIQFTIDGDDIFSRLPEELLTDILIILPSTSVRNIQLASKKMASVHLSSRYWRSRFDFPNELCHVKLPPTLLKSGRVGERWVDWRRLCDQLLHPVGDHIEWWRNRKRITALNRKVVKSMLLRRSDGKLELNGVVDMSDSSDRATASVLAPFALTGNASVTVPDHPGWALVAFAAVLGWYQ